MKPYRIELGYETVTEFGYPVLGIKRTTVMLSEFVDIEPQCNRLFPNFVLLKYEEIKNNNNDEDFHE